MSNSEDGKQEVTPQGEKDGKQELTVQGEKDGKQELTPEEQSTKKHFSEAYFNLLGGIEIAAVSCGLPYSGMKNHYMNDEDTKEFLDKFSKENAQWIEQNKLVIRLGSKIFESYMLFLLSRKILNQKGPKNE
jgi:hypothetical protein